MSVLRAACLAMIASAALGCAEQPFSAPPSYGYQPYGAPAYPYGAMAPPLTWGIAGPSAAAARAVAFAYSRVGTPYCYGGNGPRCFDCSGLTRAAWLAGGKAIPRTSSEQVARLPAVPMNAVVPGDILWKPGHVGLYVGQGWAIAATHTGDVVRYQPASSFVRAVRP